MKTMLIALALFASTTLAQVPRYSVTMSPDDFQLLYSRDIFSDSLLPASFFTADSSWSNDGFRFKGTSTRFYSKKSYRVRFATAQLFRAQRDINFNAMYTDKSFLREYLAWNLFGDLQEMAPVAEHALVSVNGRPQGLYLLIDKIDKYFLQRRGRILAPMYEADDTYNEANLTEQPDSLLKLYYAKEIGSKTDYSDLTTLIHALNSGPDSSFADTVDRYFDVGSVLNWFAGNTIMMMGDSYDKNYFLYRDTSRATGQWTIIPWDYDLSFGRTGDPAVPYPASLLNDRFAYTFPPLSGPSNPLKDRFMATPSLAERFRARLDTVLQTVFTPERLVPRIDSLASYIRTEAANDPGKWGTAQEFEDHVDALKYYVNARRNYLLRTFVHPPSGQYNRATLPVSQTGVPYDFVAYDGRQLATLWFSSMSGLDSIQVIAHPDSTPPSLALPGDGRFVRRWIEVIPYPSGASFTARLQWMYEDVATASTEVGQGVQDERLLRAFVFDGAERRALGAAVNPYANIVTIDSVTAGECGAGKHFGLAMADTYTQTWFRAPLYNWQRWHDVRFWNPLLGWILGDHGTVLKTTDGGATWAEKAIGFNVIFSQLAVLTADTLLAAGNAGAVYRSIDGGENWSRVDAGVTADLRALSFADHRTGYAAGDGVVLRTSDGGGSWTTIASDTAASFQCLGPVGSDSLLAGTLTGLTRFSSTDGGQTWTPHAEYHSAPVRAVVVRDSTEFWAAGDSGQVRHRSFPGIGVVLQTPGTAALRALAVLDSAHLYAAGDRGTIWYSEDGGAHWHAQYSADSHDLFALCFTDRERGYAAGSGGTVLSTTSAGTVTGVAAGDPAVPSEFLLSQNYPNPFNPETRIEYRIAHAGPVTLTVYDLLGRVVATLVDEVKAPGEYRAVWNASGAASGVYFCQLLSGNARETRKLMLLR
jgi:spore coat protein CotH/photosystem II stability/assembly factor-like uncharacterized protein